MFNQGIPTEGEDSVRLTSSLWYVILHKNKNMASVWKATDLKKLIQGVNLYWSFHLGKDSLVLPTILWLLAMNNQAWQPVCDWFNGQLLIIPRVPKMFSKTKQGYRNNYLRPIIMSNFRARFCIKLVLFSEQKILYLVNLQA